MEIDGKKLLEQVMRSVMAKDSDNKELMKMLNVFEKHNIGLFDAMAILLELSIILNATKGEE